MVAAGGSKVVSVGEMTDWATTPADDASTAARITQSADDARERTLWLVAKPIVLRAAAVALSFRGARWPGHLHERFEKGRETTTSW